MDTSTEPKKETGVGGRILTAAILGVIGYYLVSWVLGSTDFSNLQLGQLTLNNVAQILVAFGIGAFFLKLISAALSGEMFR